MTPAQLKDIKRTIEATIQEKVNGKIERMDQKLDAHNASHENDMKRMMPVIEAFEKGKQDLDTAQRGGKIVLWVAATVTAIGGAYLIIVQVFQSIYK